MCVRLLYLAYWGRNEVFRVCVLDVVSQFFGLCVQCRLWHYLYAESYAHLGRDSVSCFFRAFMCSWHRVWILLFVRPMYALGPGPRIIFYEHWSGDVLSAFFGQRFCDLSFVPEFFCSCVQSKCWRGFNGEFSTLLSILLYFCRYWRGDLPLINPFLYLNKLLRSQNVDNVNG